eukprot:TRINITY_DN2041_c0_g1_i8.p1 TRINITY_DN2041_c0_g1~~TRINITY_DN2041_c0_g1_i8.p1  ORF type:complete len:193 (-),score=-21.12 TRINITY_DN2041_c0_g1_i8:89-667(-)
MPSHPKSGHCSITISTPHSSKSSCYIQIQVFFYQYILHTTVNITNNINTHQLILTKDLYQEHNNNKQNNANHTYHLIQQLMHTDYQQPSVFMHHNFFLAIIFLFQLQYKFKKIDKYRPVSLFGCLYLVKSIKKFCKIYIYIFFFLTLKYYQMKMLSKKGLFNKFIQVIIKNLHKKLRNLPKMEIFIKTQPKN